MKRSLKYIYALGIFFLICICGHAQYTDTTTIVAAPQEDYLQNEQQQFDEIHSGPLQVRTIPAEKVNQSKADKDYWYHDSVPEREKKANRPRPKKEKDFTFSPLFKTVFWVILIAAFVALVIWFLSTSDIRLFRKRPAELVTEEQEEESETENIFEMNFEKEIQKAVNAQNFRLAVRLLYLRTLRDLSQRNIISYTHEKTNSDYLFQLAGSNYYRDFFRLTRNFDYIWYGQFELSPDNYNLIRNDFSSFKNRLS
jgi:hypothetical protein